MELVESELRALGVRALHLEVERSNSSAQRFYASLGFEDRSRFFMMSKRLRDGEPHAADARAGT
jgi:ribosomal protein S18 acetylase RimI-like enzyme